jgi:hypothetical protein
MNGARTASLALVLHLYSDYKYEQAQALAMTDD